MIEVPVNHPPANIYSDAGVIVTRHTKEVQQAKGLASCHANDPDKRDRLKKPCKRQWSQLRQPREDRFNHIKSGLEARPLSWRR